MVVLLQDHLDQSVYYAYIILYASSIYGFRVFKTTSYLGMLVVRFFHSLPLYNTGKVQPKHTIKFIEGKSRSLLPRVMI